jgi:hypothetical protein
MYELKLFGESSIQILLVLRDVCDDHSCAEIHEDLCEPSGASTYVEHKVTAFDVLG